MRVASLREGRSVRGWLFASDRASPWQGFNACLLCCGEASSGQSYTMRVRMLPCPNLLPLEFLSFFPLSLGPLTLLGMSPGFLGLLRAGF